MVLKRLKVESEVKISVGMCVLSLIYNHAVVCVLLFSMLSHLFCVFCSLLRSNYSFHVFITLFKCFFFVFFLSFDLHFVRSVFLYCFAYCFSSCI